MTNYLIYIYVMRKQFLFLSKSLIITLYSYLPHAYTVHLFRHFYMLLVTKPYIFKIWNIKTENNFFTCCLGCFSHINASCLLKSSIEWRFIWWHYTLTKSDAPPLTVFSFVNFVQNSNQLGKDGYGKDHFSDWQLPLFATVVPMM